MEAENKVMTLFVWCVSYPIDFIWWERMMYCRWNWNTCWLEHTSSLFLARNSLVISGPHKIPSHERLQMLIGIPHPRLLLRKSSSRLSGAGSDQRRHSLSFRKIQQTKNTVSHPPIQWCLGDGEESDQCPTCKWGEFVDRISYFSMSAKVRTSFARPPCTTKT